MKLGLGEGKYRGNWGIAEVTQGRGRGKEVQMERKRYDPASEPELKLVIQDQRGTKVMLPPCPKIWESSIVKCVSLILGRREGNKRAVQAAEKRPPAVPFKQPGPRMRSFSE